MDNCNAGCGLSHLELIKVIAFSVVLFFIEQYADDLYQYSKTVVKKPIKLEF